MSSLRPGPACASVARAAADLALLLLETAGYSVVHASPRMIATRPREFTDGIAAWLAARAVELGVAA
jgi:hypothetical protein